MPITIINKEPVKLYSDDIDEKGDSVFDDRNYIEEYKDVYYVGKSAVGEYSNISLRNGFHEVLFMVNGSLVEWHKYNKHCQGKMANSMDYSVDTHGVVDSCRVQHRYKPEVCWASPGAAPKIKMDLSTWYKLRSLGGSDEWLSDLNKIILSLEEC